MNEEQIVKPAEQARQGSHVGLIYVLVAGLLARRHRLRDDGVFQPELTLRRTP